MQFNFDIDLQAIVSKTMAPEAIGPILEKAITKAFTDCVEDATGYRSEFRTKLKQQLGEALPHGLTINDVAKFQHLLNGSIASALHGANIETITTAIAKVQSSVLPDVPSRIKLSEFLKEARHGLHVDEGKSFYAYLNLSPYGGGWLYLDGNARPGGGRSWEDREDCKYKASHNLAFNKEGEIYALRMDGAVVTPKSQPQSVGQFAGLLLSMYVGRTTLEIDLDDDGVREASSEQDYD